MPHTWNCGKLAVTMATTITWHNSVLQLQTVYLGLVLDAKKKTKRLTVGTRWLLPETRSDLDWNTLPELRFNRWLLGPNQFTKPNRTWRSLSQEWWSEYWFQVSWQVNKWDLQQVWSPEPEGHAHLLSRCRQIHKTYTTADLFLLPASRFWLRPVCLFVRIYIYI